MKQQVKRTFIDFCGGNCNIFAVVESFLKPRKYMYFKEKIVFFGPHIPYDTRKGILMYSEILQISWQAKMLRSLSTISFPINKCFTFHKL